MNYILSLFLLMGISSLSFAQSLPWNQLNINQQLPETLQNGRTAVLIQAPTGGKSAQPRWKRLARELHSGLRALQIDPVAYYDYRAVDAGPDVLEAYATTLRKRGIDQLLIVQQEEQLRYTFIPLGKERLFDAGAAAWQVEAASPKEVRQVLEKDLEAARLRKGNLLILEVPEFYASTDDIPIKKRFFSYPPDLKLDKFAVPAYELFGSVQADSLQELQSIMAAYPFQWGITEPGTAEQDLRLKQGYQFVLLYMHTLPSNIRTYLMYPPEKDATLEQAPAYTAAEEPVYKFYIRHVYSGDVYTGTYWDAASSWQEALRQFISGLNREFNQ